MGVGKITQYWLTTEYKLQTQFQLSCIHEICFGLRHDTPKAWNNDNVRHLVQYQYALVGHPVAAVHACSRVCQWVTVCVCVCVYACARVCVCVSVVYVWVSCACMRERGQDWERERDSQRERDSDGLLLSGFKPTEPGGGGGGGGNHHKHQTKYTHTHFEYHGYRHVILKV